MTTQVERSDPDADSLGGWYLQPRPVFSGGNQVTLLRGGDALFPAMCEAIDSARHEVWLATYIFHHDAAAVPSVVATLVAAARRGVAVSVVVDGFGGAESWPLIERTLNDGGVRTAVFRPMRRWWNWLQPGQLRRLHQKLCAVDAEVAFVGGINLIDDRLDLRHGVSEQPRLDYAVRVRGPMAQAVHQTARAIWTRASLGRAFGGEMAALARSAQPVARARELLGRLRTQDPSLAPANAADLAPVRAAFVVRDNFRQRRSIERSYVEAIRKAHTSIDLVSPYFYPGRTFRRALREAARRGVRVRLLLQGQWDYRMAALAAYALYDEMLGRGMLIHEYTAAFLHAKVAVIDDDWATVGSSNIDPMSLLLNLEANVIVRDRDFAAGLRQEFETALAGAKAVTRSEGGSGTMALLRRGFVAWCARLYLRVAGATGRY